MPCNCDYMGASGKEIQLSRVASLLDELDGKKINETHWSGYHPKIYNRNVDGDKLVAELCDRLSQIDVTKQSLEMQIWWRDHKEADKVRIEEQLADAKTKRARAEAIKKLTQNERKLLGL